MFYIALWLLVGMGLVFPHVPRYVHDFLFDALGFKQGILTSKEFVDGTVVNVVDSGDERVIKE